VRDLNRLYTNEPALFEVDFHWDGFQWVDLNDIENSVISFLRFSKDREQKLMFVCNFTPIVRREYKIAVEHDGFYRQILNTDDSRYGGSGVGGVDGVWAEPNPHLGKPYLLNLTLPPLGVLAFRLEGRPA
jgi:1,4-alpha-glucan branching enzyme